MQFLEYVDKKERESRRELNILKDVLEQNHFKTKTFLENIGDPYIFVYTPKNIELPFEGIRIYKIGKNMAFRVQNEPDAEPYGKAYMLDVEKIYEDQISDTANEEEAGKQVIKCIIEDITRFFNQSASARAALKDVEIQKSYDPLSRVVIGTNGTDYANTVTSKT